MKIRLLIAGCGALPLALAALPAAAQAPLPYNIGNAVREGEAARQAPLPQAQPAPVLPQLAEPSFTLKDNETLQVDRFEVDGPPLADAAEVRGILAPYEKRKLTLNEIYEAADKLTTLYRSRGYLVAKAHVPAQDASSGVLKIKVVPGKYGSITIDDQSLVGEGHLRGVIEHSVAASPHVHNDEIERAMLLISDLPGAAMPRVAIGPGSQPETSDFVFTVPEALRVDGYVLADNFGSPFTGRDRVSAGIDLNSPLGYGDRLSAFGIVSERSNLVNGRIGYAFPIGTDGWSGEIAAYRTTYTLGGIYKVLDATGTADAITGTLAYALVRQADRSFGLVGNFTHKALNDQVLGSSLANRTIDLGTAGVVAKTAGTVMSWPVTTSTTVGLTQGSVAFANDAQRATNVAGPNTVGYYAKLNLAFLATVAFSEKLSLTTSIAAQRSLTGNLDSSEQIGLTGYSGVRAFDEGLSGDNGFLVTPELKYALPDIAIYHHAVGVFTDLGGASLANAAFTTTQKSYTQLNDFGIGYYATLDYSTGRSLLLKAQLVHSMGSVDGAGSYNRPTKGLVQVGFTF